MTTYHKAYVYLTCGNDLLVFDEPDFPDIGLQVPGGTVDPGESFLIGAKREFIEETGLELDRAFDLFTEQDLDFDAPPLNGSFPTTQFQPLKGRHLRRHYHVRIADRPADTWERMEMSPSNGGPPIRFRLYWIDLFGNQAMKGEGFHACFDEPLEALRNRFRGK